MKLGSVVLRDIIAQQMRNLQTTPDDMNPVIRSDSGWDLLQANLLERKTGGRINEGCAVKGIFCYAFINKFAVEECLLVNSNREGNTSGMLITEKFWR